MTPQHPDIDRSITSGRMLCQAREEKQIDLRIDPSMSISPSRSIESCVKSLRAIPEANTARKHKFVVFESYISAFLTYIQCDWSRGWFDSVAIAEETFIHVCELGKKRVLFDGFFFSKLIHVETKLNVECSNQAGDSTSILGNFVFSHVQGQSTGFEGREPYLFTKSGYDMSFSMSML